MNQTTEVTCAQATGSSDSHSCPNCTVVNTTCTWSDEMLLQSHLNGLLNSTQDIAEKVNGFHSFTDEQISYSQNNTDKLNQVLQTTETSAQKLASTFITVANLKDTSITTAGVINDILLVVEDLLNAFISVFLSSCREIKERLPNIPSGMYLLLNSSGESQYVYCNMGELCGSGGGWTRLAYLNMSDSTVNCPSGFKLYEQEGVRACGRAYSSSGSCQSVIFPSHGISYSQVCGRVVGYQYGKTNAVHNSQHNNLNSYYVDGVSITHGSPRQHVWTLIAGLYESKTYSTWNCPCSNGSNQQVQSFVGNNYFCESGNPDQSTQYHVYTNDTLWDGQGCGSIETACCNAPGLPWFHRDYGQNTTTDYLELRVCGNEETSNEDVPVAFYEIYVK